MGRDGGDFCWGKDFFSTKKGAGHFFQTINRPRYPVNSTGPQKVFYLAFTQLILKSSNIKISKNTIPSYLGRLFNFHAPIKTKGTREGKGEDPRALLSLSPPPPFISQIVFEKPITHPKKVIEYKIFSNETGNSNCDTVCPTLKYLISSLVQSIDCWPALGIIITNLAKCQLLSRGRNIPCLIVGRGYFKKFGFLDVNFGFLRPSK